MVKLRQQLNGGSGGVSDPSVSPAADATCIERPGSRRRRSSLHQQGQTGKVESSADLVDAGKQSAGFVLSTQFNNAQSDKQALRPLGKPTSTSQIDPASAHPANQPHTESRAPPVTSSSLVYAPLYEPASQQQQQQQHHHIHHMSDQQSIHAGQVHLHRAPNIQLHQAYGDPTGNYSSVSHIYTRQPFMADQVTATDQAQLENYEDQAAAEDEAASLVSSLMCSLGSMDEASPANQNQSTSPGARAAEANSQQSIKSPVSTASDDLNTIMSATGGRVPDTTSSYFMAMGPSTTGTSNQSTSDQTGSNQQQVTNQQSRTSSYSYGNSQPSRAPVIYQNQQNSDNGALFIYQNQMVASHRGPIDDKQHGVNLVELPASSGSIGESGPSADQMQPQTINRDPNSNQTTDTHQINISSSTQIAQSQPDQTSASGVALTRASPLGGDTSNQLGVDSLADQASDFCLAALPSISYLDRTFVSQVLQSSNHQLNNHPSNNLDQLHHQHQMVQHSNIVQAPPPPPPPTPPQAPHHSHLHNSHPHGHPISHPHPHPHPHPHSHPHSHSHHHHHHQISHHHHHSLPGVQRSL